MHRKRGAFALLSPECTEKNSNMNLFSHHVFSLLREGNNPSIVSGRPCVMLDSVYTISALVWHNPFEVHRVS